MNIERTGKVLKKINRLYELVLSFDEPSQTERDLLKAYVLDLYEAVITPEETAIEELNDQALMHKIEKHQVIETTLQSELGKAPEPVTTIAEEHVAIEHEEDIDDEDAANQVETVEENDQTSEDETRIDPDLIELFDIQESAELSDRLANAPIPDLTKAMGINEKIFTVNELFGGNQKELDNMLSALNGLDSFSEAKTVLQTSVAQKYAWSDPAKVNKAKTFIRLIKRRYN